MNARRLTPAELEASPYHCAQPRPHCTGACDQGRAPCDCTTASDPPQMWDVESHAPYASAVLCALIITVTIVFSVLITGCGGSDDEVAAAPDTPSPRQPACTTTPGVCT